MYLVFDTETYKDVNLQKVNIHEDKPFLFSYTYLDNKLNQLEEGWFRKNDPMKHNHFIELVKQCKVIVGANIKYDIHMCLNDGIPLTLFEDKNYIDIEVLARLCLHCDIQDDPRFTVALKPLAKKYIGVDSDVEEKQLKHELSLLTMTHKKLYHDELFKTYPNLSKKELDKTTNDTYNNDSWFKHFDEYDYLTSFRDNFFKQHRRPDYRDCRNVTTYAMTDARLTTALFKLWYPKLIPLKQGDAMKRISAATIPLVVMEAEGLEIDVNKLLEDRKKVKAEYDLVCSMIKDPRTGEILTPSQNAKLKSVYEYESNLMLDNADKKTRTKLIGKSPTAELVSYARNLEKYLTTYMTGLLQKITYVNGVPKLYTQYMQAGTITGRLSSDFQQFPKFPLELKDGTEINIRSWFVVPKGAVNMCYMD